MSKTIHHSLIVSPPDEPYNTFDTLEEILGFFEAEGKEIMLLGDANCNFSTARSMNRSKSPVPSHVKHLKDLYQSFGLKQLISEPTRKTENTSTLIDHIAVGNTNNTVDSGVVKIAISDHYVIYTVRKYQGGTMHNHKHIHRGIYIYIQFKCLEVSGGQFNCIMSFVSVGSLLE